MKKDAFDLEEKMHTKPMFIGDSDFSAEPSACFVKNLRKVGLMKGEGEENSNTCPFPTDW